MPKEQNAIVDNALGYTVRFLADSLFGEEILK
jgi:hypothetical protein